CATLMVLGTLALLARWERIIRQRVSHRRYTAAVDPGSEAFERLLERFSHGKLQVKVERVEKTGGHVEVTFRVMGPMPDHDHLMKHMLQDEGVHRFSRS
ncbi:MAG: hypothetical protein ACJ8J0_08045, partial [Longimicrobiaceae bacterium]